MLILGIDPGTATVGFGYVEVSDGQPARALSYGVIQTDKTMAMPERLRVVFDDMTELLGDLSPDVMVVEELFFFRNTNTAIPVAQARGVILLAAAQAGVPVVSYTPMQVKKTVTGTGKAEKIEVQEAIRDLLDLESIPRPDDAADALSLALTHWQHLEGIGETHRVSHLGAGGGRG
jgi:crossover junction endodeoxyribonuclease RuvC